MTKLLRNLFPFRFKKDKPTLGESGWASYEPTPYVWPVQGTSATNQWTSESESARKAIQVLAKALQCQIDGRSPAPLQDEVEQAWTILEGIDLALAGYLRLQMQQRLSLPVCPRTKPSGPWLAATKALAARNLDLVISGLFGGAELRSWPDLDDVLARRIEHATRGRALQTVFANGPVAARERHLVDGRGRVLIQRLIERGPSGRLEILDFPGGILSRTTMERSLWALEDGWKVLGGPEPRMMARREGGGNVGPVSEPPAPKA